MIRLFLLRFVASVLLSIASYGVVAAGSTHGIAMHGNPKYDADFTHLDYSNKNAPKGGELRLGLTGSFDSLNPFIIKGRSAAGRQYVFESLLARVWDEPFSLYGLIAEKVEVPGDRSWVTFTLNPAARFHDGSPITVDDVLFSWSTLRDKGRANMRMYYSKVKTAQKVGERGVRFIFKGEELDRELPLIMGLMPVISRRYYQDIAFDETTLKPPLGSGPYRVAAVEAGRSIVYERVPDYWGDALPVRVGHNNFAKVRYDYFRDANVLLEAFKAGEYDLRGEYSASRWINSYDFPAVKKGDVVLEELSNRRPAGMRAFAFNIRKEKFKDVRVRKALVQAFDFEWINENLLHSAYKRTESFFANSDLAATGLPTSGELTLLEPFRGQVSDEVFTKVYSAPRTDGNNSLRGNLRLAQKLLEDAGWTIEDGELVSLANGTSLNFEILLVSPDNERIALAYARNLKRLGVAARVRTVDSAQYQERRQKYDFDMIIHRWRVSLSPGNEQAYYWGSKAASQPGTRNYIGIESHAVDSLIEHVTNSVDRDALVNGMRALDRVLLHDHYVVPLYHLDKDRVAYWNRLGHPQNTPIYGFVLETWWQDPKKALALPR